MTNDHNGELVDAPPPDAVHATLLCDANGARRVRRQVEVDWHAHLIQQQSAAERHQHAAMKQRHVAGAVDRIDLEDPWVVPKVSRLYFESQPPHIDRPVESELDPLRSVLRGTRRPPR